MVQRSLIAKPELKSIDEGYMAVEYIGRNLRKQNKSNSAHAWGKEMAVFKYRIWRGY